MATKKPAKAPKARKKLKDITVKKSSAIKGGRRKMSDPCEGEE